ncbi:GNAT family acetyltransferase [Luteolibacter sp. LG18]|uniref:GNAT family acetyltransferase n=1 Tax=Luteolibacter sp. LG18 TaxID=2819286 RepID=UPI002B2A8ECB|nr:GNAT family acetyltransferase [Luteolibacter sp. LG18]
MVIRTYQPRDQDAVIELWGRCGLLAPQNNPVADIQRKLADSPELFLVGVMEAGIVATVMAGYEGHRGWINYLAVAPHLQKGGHGRRIMERAEELLCELGCPKINLQVRSTNTRVIEFYERLGFSCDPVTSMGKRLIVDEPLER